MLTSCSLIPAKWKTSCSAHWLRLLIKSWKWELECILYTFLPIPTMLVLNLWTEKKKWKNVEMPKSYRSCSQRKIPQISKCLQLDDPLKFWYQKMGECDKRNTCVTIPQKSGQPLSIHMQCKTIFFVCRQFPDFIRSSITILKNKGEACSFADRCNNSTAFLHLTISYCNFKSNTVKNNENILCTWSLWALDYSEGVGDR